MMKISKMVVAALGSAVFFTACSPDNDEPTKYVPLGKYDSGVLVLNQGGFGNGDASVSYLSADFSKFENDIFSLANPDVILGDTAQDIAFNGQLAYIVLNGSNKIEIVNRYTFKSVGTIEEGFSNPRYMAIYNGNGYVTNWGAGDNPNDDYVAVVNLASGIVTSTIPVAEGPERIIEYNGKLYIAQIGGFNFGNQISVINIATNEVATITVGDVPNALQIKDGYLWISYAGKPSYAAQQTAGGLVQININTNAVAHAYGYADITKHISNLVIEGGFAYYTVNSGVYQFDLSSAALPNAPIFTSAAQNVYSFAMRLGHFYVGDAVDFANAGKVYVYSTGAGGGTVGAPQGSYTVGVTPAGFYFNL
jgi:uncharacterized protein DUF5074